MIDDPRIKRTPDERAEYEKYKNMWQHDDYRTFSPGASAVPMFLKYAEWSAGEVIIDVGCGTGRAGAALKAAGLNTYLLDIISEAVEERNMTFLEMNIWNMPEWIRTDWIFCVDVLEHIPFKYISDTFFNLGRACRRGGYLQIACFEDICGRLIGEKLHLTVKTPDWWAEIVESYFNIELDFSDKEWARFIVGKK